MRSTHGRGRLLSPGLYATEHCFTRPHQLPEECGEPDMTEAAEKDPTKEEGCDQSASNMRTQLTDWRRQETLTY